jgi:iron complex outermembrane recepter protein
MAFFAQPALAQDAPADTADAPKEGEIIVTAQKRSENVQKIPLAVSVLAPSALKAAGVTQFQDLGRVAPSLTVRPAEHPVNANVSLRGVGTFAFGIGVEPSVAVLVDEVPLAFQARAFTDLPDVERIEVLRGPQSTLYGKSASAGLINIITRNPTDTVKFRANVLVTTDSEFGGNFSVSGPAGETLGYVVSASYSKWKGNVKNLFNGKSVNGREAFTGRAKLRWEPSSDAKIILSLNYLKGNTSVGRPFIRMGAGALLRGSAGLTPAVTMPGVVVSLTNQDISNNYDARTTYEGGGGNLRGEFALGGHTLISITSYDKFKLDDFLDSDDTSSNSATNFGNNIQVGTFKSSLFTQELRLLSPGDKPFRYTIGAYLGHVAFERPFERGPYFSQAQWFATAKSTQISGFVQADWEFLPHATLTGGGRVQNEKVSYTFLDIRNGNAAFAGSAEDTAATWKASLRYEFTPDISMFATYATGYKGQTFDLTTGFNAARAAAGPIRPETSKDREIGVRTQFLDRKLTLNLTYFNTDYTDLQAQTIEVVGGTNNFRLTNVGGLKTKGVEVDFAARPSDDFTLSASVAYLDATYSSYERAQCYPLQTAALGCVAGSPSYQVMTGQRAVQAPEWKWTAGMEYAPALGGKMRGVLQANLQYTGDQNYGLRDPELFQKAYTIVNAGIGLRSEDRSWEITAFVNNLFDKQYFPALVNSAGNWGGNIATQALLPRDFHRYGGVRASLNF